MAVIEGFIAGTRQYIDNLKELPEFAEDHKKNRTAVPVIILAAQSYHYRERTMIETLVGRYLKSTIFLFFLYAKGSDEKLKLAHLYENSLFSTK